MRRIDIESSCLCTTNDITDAKAEVADEATGSGQGAFASCISKANIFLRKRRESGSCTV